jgi:AcrR family transcriptional regulator
MDASWNQPLPRGRHHLTREEVAASQRGRIVMAMLEEVAARGYAATSVAHITARAGVSRKSFYEQFSDKEHCYLVAFDAAAEIHTAIVVEATARLRPESRPVEYFRAMLRAYLDAVAAHPAVARTLLVEVYAVGPEAMKNKLGARNDVLAHVLAPLGVIDDGRLTFEGEALAAAISALVTQLVAEGRTDEAPRLLDPLVDWVSAHAHLPTTTAHAAVVASARHADRGRDTAGAGAH